MKKELSTKKQFTEAISYIKEIKKFIYASIIFFVVSAILGYIFRDDLTFINELLLQILEKTKGLNTPEMIFFILQNNLLSAILAITIGVLFGIFPIINTISNGVVLGYVFGIASDLNGLSVIFQILPHGIFELPAIFISFGMGIKLGFTLFLNKKKRMKEFRRRFYSTANTLLMIVIPLLIIAAAIEGLLISFLG